jgi:superfamily II DNA helicase RecQ
MQCKVFSLPLEPEALSEKETKVNEFLKAARVKRVFASMANSQKGDLWMVMFFYDESESTFEALETRQVSATVQSSPLQAKTTSNFNGNSAAQGPAPDAATPLTGEQVKWIIALKQWRADQAAQEGVPLYMVAQNKWLEEIVRMPARGFQDLLKVRGLGEWRAKKYGTKILETLGLRPDSSGDQRQWNQ